MDVNAFLDNIPCGVIGIRRDNTIAFWNADMVRITGIAPERVIGKGLDAFPFYKRKDNSSIADFTHCLSENKVVRDYVFIRDRDGGFRPVFVQLQAIGARPAAMATKPGRTNNSDEHVSGDISNAAAATKPGALSGDDDDWAFVTLTDISEVITCYPAFESEMMHRSDGLAEMIGSDEKMRHIYEQVRFAADSAVNVLIQGESGTGKELVARAIHSLSDRKDRPFVAVNCSALTESLLESELFGHVKGAFTGAYRDKEGKFESAAGGTIFLDEIGDISPFIQVKLLRVIQDKTIARVGDNQERKVDMRIVTATNRDLRALVASGDFREDLFYRLRVFPIHTIPLREHKRDIPLLVRHFIARFNHKTGKSIEDLAPDAMRLVMEYCWPGNVRELENTIEYAFVVASGRTIDVFDLPQELRQIQLRSALCPAASDDGEAKAVPGADAGGDPKPENGALPNTKSRRVSITKKELESLLATYNGNRTKAAEMLGISRVGLWKMMKRLGLGG